MKCSIVTLQSVRAGTNYTAQSAAKLPGTNCKYIFILIKESRPTDKPQTTDAQTGQKPVGKENIWLKGKTTIAGPFDHRNVQNSHRRLKSHNILQCLHLTGIRYFFVFVFLLWKSLTRLLGICDPSPTQTVKEFCLADSAKLQNPRASLMTICSAETSLTPPIITPDQNA